MQQNAFGEGFNGRLRDETKIGTRTILALRKVMS
jgi:hypothetical protein